jgi:hypothetical protein
VSANDSGEPFGPPIVDGDASNGRAHRWRELFRSDGPPAGFEEVSPSDAAAPLPPPVEPPRFRNGARPLDDGSSPDEPLEAPDGFVPARSRGQVAGFLRRVNDVGRRINNVGRRSEAPTGEHPPDAYETDEGSPASVGEDRELVGAAVQRATPLTGDPTVSVPAVRPQPTSLAPTHGTPLDARAPAVYDPTIARQGGPRERILHAGQLREGPVPLDPSLDPDRPQRPPRPQTPHFTSLRRRRRPRVRRVTRVIRHVDPWSVFKVALCFSLVLYGVCLTAGVLLWNVAYTTGTIDNMQRFFESFGWDTFRFNGGQLYHNAWIAGLFAALGLTGLIVLAATLFNLITDLVGGIRVTVLEEEVVERDPITKQFLRRRSRHTTSVVHNAGATGIRPDDEPEMKTYVRPGQPVP